MFGVGLAVLFTICALTTRARCMKSDTVNISVNTDYSINDVENAYLSFTIDSNVYQKDIHWYKFNFSSPKLHTLMRSLSPALLRNGGTSADWVFFDKPLKIIDDLKLKPKASVMTKADVVNLVGLTRSTGNRLVFDLNLQFRFGTQWDPSNAIELLEFCSQMEFGDSIDWELGNEPDWYNDTRNQTTLTPEQLGNDFLILNNLIDRYANLRNSAIIGPDVGRPTSKVGRKLFSGVANIAGFVLDALTFHHYYFRGDTATYLDYLNPVHFSDLEYIINAAKSDVNTTQYPHVPLWLGETSTAYNSGTRNVSDRFVSGFLWMEKLGLAAALGIKVVMRQTFYGGNYALLDLNMDPNPDFWISWMHKILVGRRVFNVTLTGVNKTLPTTRVYAHCTNSLKSGYASGAVTVFAINFSPNINKFLSFPSQWQRQRIDSYQVEPDGPDGVLSKWVKLNGKRLVMPSEFSMPELIPKKLSPGSPIILPPLTIAFYVWPDANVMLCV